MKQVIFLLTAACTLGLASCDGDFLTKLYPPSRPPVMSASPGVLVLTVDQTTGQFASGWSVAFQKMPDRTGIDCTYNSPGDFGDITFIEASSGVRLFAGTVVWNGAGRITYPEPITAIGFARNFSAIDCPPSEVVPITFYTCGDPTTAYVNRPVEEIWSAVADLDVVRAAREKRPDVPVYISAYWPSVGVGGNGSPGSLWLIFIYNP